VFICTEGITLGVTLQVTLYEYYLLIRVCALFTVPTLVLDKICVTTVRWLGKMTKRGQGIFHKGQDLICGVVVCGPCWARKFRKTPKL